MSPIRLLMLSPTPIRIELLLLSLAHTCIWTRDFYASRNVTHVTLTLTSETALRFRHLRLVFKNMLFYTHNNRRKAFYIWHTHELGQDLSM